MNGKTPFQLFRVQSSMVHVQGWHFGPGLTNDTTMMVIHHHLKWEFVNSISFDGVVTEVKFLVMINWYRCADEENQQIVDVWNLLIVFSIAVESCLKPVSTSVQFTHHHFHSILTMKMMRMMSVMTLTMTVMAWLRGRSWWRPPSRSCPSATLPPPGQVLAPS